MFIEFNLCLKTGKNRQFKSDIQPVTSSADAYAPRTRGSYTRKKQMAHRGRPGMINDFR